MKKKSLNKKHMLSAVFATLFFALPSYAAESNKHHSSKHSSKQVNFGPGDQYLHRMSVKPSDYQKLKEISRKASDLPKPLLRKRVEKISIELTASEVIAEIAPGISYHYWTFNNTVPGPFLRVRVGDTVELNLHNAENSSHSHAIDLHAVTGPGGGMAVTQVEPGESKTLVFKATTPGLYTYHCASGNPATHIANGMYGMILVEPTQGLAKVDHEFYVMQGELYTHGKIGKKGFQAFDSRKMIDERPEYIVFNGRTGALVGDGQLTARVGDKIRLFVGNSGVAKISSFHVIGEIFDTVYPEASLSNPIHNVQTTLIPAGGATMVEFQVDYPGNYVLVDHALTRIDRGAWGVLKVTGKKDNTLYSGDSSSHAEHSEDH
ncbi:nitrite reductase (NO-forming) [Bathymodiolus japonicus methanotrophic gill symbiont]|uniref:copper-containing nitrite reductase n=1 Tax=Bathymodiolus japonicus methanotrophic gill symbiont TaxID=113269 RepID=UPI001B627869|nr:copper-containing nitrite reductase [Bathymodiolus japonicus methanotrophic gill symbiont]GFO71220.1 nitrite reductase (NO-forming) [Bathymodiolus japonicus methanotrophic gill symbiont]